MLLIYYYSIAQQYQCGKQFLIIFNIPNLFINHNTR